MNQQNRNASEQLTALLQVAVQKLPVKTMQRLVKHTEAIASALAAAAAVIDADASSSGYPEPAVEQVGSVMPLKRISAEAAEAELQRRTGPGDVGKLLTSEVFGERAGIKSRQTVHQWVKKGAIIGLEGEKRGLQLPAEQLDARGQPIPHLEALQGIFVDGYTLWMWLRSPVAVLVNRTPLELLRTHEIDRAIAAAHAEQQGDFG